uniref:Phytocyanin domain-containing protein n=1 Tax=Oryza barthii TaxID=65489 RepID=A0A0D3GW65_9ORYZ
MEWARGPAMAAAAAVVMVAAVLAGQAMAAGATTYTVGAPDGLWDMETDYKEWVARRTFHPGDKLTFTYSRELHDVVEVTKAGYDACSNANNISAFRSGNDLVALTAVGTRYFLCGLTGHCGSGMKIRIDVVAAASSGPAAAAAPLPSTSSVTAAVAGSRLVLLIGPYSMAIMAARALLVVAMAAAVLGTALGATYTVGAPSGSWDLRTNYDQWVSNINFRAGDQIVFKYSPAAHDVLEVNKADYDSCSSSSPIATFNSGDDTIPLTAAGTRYFICGFNGHCTGGMKVAVKVEATTGSNPAPSPMTPRPRTPTAMAPNAMPPTAGGRPVPPSSSASQPAGVASLVGLSLGAIVVARALLVVAMAAAVLGTAMGITTYTVGAPAGSWDTRTNYAQWVSAITFRVGDQLVFKYSPAAHDVVEVNKADYDSCSSSSPISTFNSGDDTIPLAAIGTRYFICGFPGHCTVGMKVAVKVEAATGSNPTPSPLAPLPRTPTAMAPNAMPPTNGGQPAPPSSSASKPVGVASLVGLSLSAIVASLMAIMAAANRSALLVVAMAAAVLATTATGATTYTVGAPAGSWDTRTNYAQWVSAITFRVSDQLVFKYSPAAHDVVEVTKAGYDSCSSSGPIATFNSGDDIVPLTAIGTRYFICGFPGHCTAGMKVAVKVEAATATGGSGTAPSPMASRPRTPTAMAPNEMPPMAGGRPVSPSSSASKSAGVASLVGLSLGAILHRSPRSSIVAAMAASARALLVVAVAAAAAVLATTAMGATTYTVGAPAGSWDTRTNYAQWASAATFRAGDRLVFRYSPAAHDVVEVTKAGYDACSAASPIATFNSGDDTVPLAAVGTRYFICGFPGHCAAGMKLTVKVEAAAAAPGGSSTTPSPSPSPAAEAPAGGTGGEDGSGHRSQLSLERMALLAVVVVAAAAFSTASGASYGVGKPNGGWDLQTNYTSWASSITFRLDDKLVFKYSAAAHDVVEVTKDGYLSCSASSPIAVHRTGEDAVELGRLGRRYFICGVPGHCDAGMKLEVRTLCSIPSPPPPGSDGDGNGTPGSAPGSSGSATTALAILAAATVMLLSLIIV